MDDKDKKNRWHQAFVVALQAALIDYRADLDFLVELLRLTRYPAKG